MAQPGQASAGAAAPARRDRRASSTAGRRWRWSSTSAPSATRPRPTAMPPGTPTSSCRGASGTGAPITACGWSMPPPPPPTATARPASTTTARPAALEQLRPLNLYGWTKHAFDLRVARAIAERRPHPPQWVGLKFFNVYGPNEYHKGRMISVVKVKHDEVAAGGPARLFRSTEPGLADGAAAARLHLGRRRGRRAAVAARHAGGERPVQRRHRPGAQLSRPGACGVRRGRRAAQGRVHRHAGGAARPVPVVHRGRDGPAARGRLSRASSRRSRKACGATCRTTWRSPTATYDPGPAVSAVRPGHRPDRAVRHPLVRAGLYRRAGARAGGCCGGWCSMAPAVATPVAGRRFPHLGDARRRARRTARLRAVLPAGRLSGASRA